MGKNRRKEVGGFKVGDAVKYRRKEWTIKSFPSRRIVVIEREGMTPVAMSILEIEKVDGEA